MKKLFILMSLCAFHLQKINAVYLNTLVSVTNVEKMNEEIVPQNIIESNEKQVNRIYLKTLALGNYDFSATHKAIIAAIAEQCPFKGGSVVYRARGLYMRKNPSLIYQDDVTCAATGGKSFGKVQFSTTKNNFEVKVAPNPANDFITLSWAKSIENVKVVITDLLGKTVYSTITNDNYLNLDSSNFPTGMYQVSVNTSETKLSHITKIIVNH